MQVSHLIEKKKIMEKKFQLFFWQVLFAFSIMLYLAALPALVHTAKTFNIQIYHSTWGVIFFILGLFALVQMVLLVLLWTGKKSALISLVDRPINSTSLKRTLAILGILLLQGTLVAALLLPHLRNYYFASFFPKLFLFWILCFLGMICCRYLRANQTYFNSLGASALLLGATFAIVVIFITVTSFPFALGWSDMSRYYGASLFFAPRLYHQFVPWPGLHPTWHLLLTVPYLFGNLPLWVHRLWQALLQLGLTLAIGVAFAKRLNLKPRTLFLGVSLWIFLFLRQISLLFSLSISVIIILGLFRPRKFWLASVIVFLASLWAGISRINWFPAPALLATMIYLLEVPSSGSKSWADYLWKPVVWFLGGTLTAFGANSLYNFLSGNAVQGRQFISSLSSELLWNRLLPSAVFPAGIFLAAALAALPLVWVISTFLKRTSESFSIIRKAGVIAIVTTLLLGGLVVSVKIGGGSDLHNLDAFFIALMLLGGYAYFRRWAPERGDLPPTPAPLPALVLGIAIPILFILQTDKPIRTWDRGEAAEVLGVISSQSQEVVRNGGEVLFLYQRQLLALKMVDVPLVADYEQDYLMEMVMSHNQAYLDRFHHDLETQRFGLIVANQYNNQIQGKNVPWAEENDLWVQEVVLPMECYYEEVDTFPNEDISLLMPKSQPCK
jgi:hypothetical protein